MARAKDTLDLLRSARRLEAATPMAADLVEPREITRVLVEVEAQCRSPEPLAPRHCDPECFGRDGAP